LKLEAQVLILGGGLAGLSLALSLTELGLKTVLVDQSSIGSGASGVPLALINPAAAKQANLSWNAESCVDAISRNLARVSHYTADLIYKKSGVLRPASDSKTLEAFQSSLQRHHFPSGWAKWLTAGELDSLLPNCRHAGGALWLNEAFTVDVPKYIEVLKSILINQGCLFFEHIESQTLHQLPSSKWQFTGSDSLEIESDHIVHCNGSGIIYEPDWNWLPVHQIKGQMSLYHSDESLNWDYSIAAHGYLAHLDNKNWVVGSTFEHHFDHLEPDSWGQEYLEKKVDSILPGLRDKSTLTQRWAGLRLGTPNRLPILGEHPQLKGRWVFTGLGSKGLLYSAFLAKQLAHKLKDSTHSIMDEIDVKRFYKHFKP